MITSRKSLGEYCLRQLGAPVIQINVAQEQVNDRIDDAIQKFNEFHGSGSERKYLQIELSANDISRKYVEVGEEVLSVLRILPLSSSHTSNLQIQAYITDILDMVKSPRGNLSSYIINMQYVSMISEMFNTSKPIRYNRYTNRIDIDMNWGVSVSEGMIIIAEVYTALDFSEFITSFNDPWMKSYATALIKKQWGQNMMKYQGFQLPSGVILDGRSIYEDALRDIEKLEDELYNTYSLPADFFVG